jgi:transposase
MHFLRLNSSGWLNVQLSERSMAMVKNLLKSAQRFNGKTLVVTVDLAKEINVGYCRCPSGAELKPFAFSNTGDGYFLFWNTAVAFQQEHRMTDIVIGFESTGIYGTPLITFLEDKPVTLVQVNPCHTKRLKELEGNSPNKTDYKDPRIIADLIELGRFLTVVVPRGVEAELRALCHSRERAVGRCNTLYNQLHDLAFAIFPEFVYVMKDLRTKTALHLLETMPLPEDIIRCGIEPLTATIRRVSRCNLRRDRAEALISAAANTVGLKEGRTGIVNEMQMLIHAIRETEVFIQSTETTMERCLEDIPYSHCLLSMKGIRSVTAASIIGEFGYLPAFKSIGEAMKFAGLNLFEISSGKRKGQRHISKRGRALIRKLLYFAALNTVRKGGIMHEKYQSYLSAGMGKNKALVAIARKLLAIMVALVRDNTEYETNHAIEKIRNAA